MNDKSVVTPEDDNQGSKDGDKPSICRCYPPNKKCFLIAIVFFCSFFLFCWFFIAWLAAQTIRFNRRCSEIPFGQIPENFQAIFSTGSRRRNAETGEVWDLTRFHFPPGSYENVTYTPYSNDLGRKLPAYWFPTNGTSAVVVTHGATVCKNHYLSLSVCNILWRQNVSCLAIDLRNHGGDWGTTDKKTLDFAVTEWRDVLGAWHFLRQKNFSDSKIGLFGQSMGGGASTIAFGMEKRIKAAYVDAPFCDPLLALQQGMFNSWLWAKTTTALFMPDLTTGGVLNYVAKDYASKIGNRSYGWLQSTGDLMIGWDNPYTCVSAAKEGKTNVTMWKADILKTWPGVSKPNATVLAHYPRLAKKWISDTHVESFLYYQNEYAQRILDFFNKSIGPF